jgi:hypothetical protein
LLFSKAIEEADPDVRSIVAILDGIRGAYKHATRSRKGLARERQIALDDLWPEP